MFAQATEFARPSFLTRGRLERRLQKMRFHMIDASQLTSLQRSETKLLAHTPFLELLKCQGQERATDWLRQHAGNLGRRSSIDIQQCFA